MDRKQINVSEMLLTLEEFMTSNLASFKNKPAILSAIDELKTKNAEIKVLNLTQSTKTEADQTIKNNEDDAIILTAVKVSDGLRVIAATNDDPRLKIDSKISQWGLSRLRKNNLYIRLKQLHATALPFLEQLLPLSITEAEVNSLETESTRLSGVKPEINNVKLKSTRATSDLDETLDYINGRVKDQLDNLMLEFKLLNPTLYSEYRIARKLNNRSAGRSSKSSKSTDTK